MWAGSWGSQREAWTAEDQLPQREKVEWIILPFLPSVLMLAQC